MNRWHTVAAAVATAACVVVLSLPALAGARPHPGLGVAAGKTVVRPVRPAVRRRHERAVPFGSLPRKIRVALRAAGVTVNTVDIAEPSVLAYPAMCLDANDSGVTAGQNGDKVQLWQCFDDLRVHPNQWWIPLQSIDGWTELMSLQYPNMCLDADSSGGFVDGAKVQLWHCINNQKTNPNQWWDFGPAGYTQLPSMWVDHSKALDANDAGPTAGQNGDKVQIWAMPGHGNNQLWDQTITSGS